MNDQIKRGPGRPPRVEPIEVDRDPIDTTENYTPGLEAQELAEEQRRAARAVADMNALQEAEDNAAAQRVRDADLKAEARRKDKKAYDGPMVEVLVTRKYVPSHIVDAEGDLIPQTQSINDTIMPGTTISLPREEAVKAVKLGNAEITSKSFDG